MSTPSSIPALVASLRTIIASNPNTGWDDAWKAKVTPWDAEKVQPALRELVEERWERVVEGGGPSWNEIVGEEGEGKGLVAGCGKGYDATFFGSKGLRTLGIDLSPTAVGLAQSLLQESTTSQPSLASLVEFSTADFFDPSVLEAGAFSLAYDYTFLCALPPSLRESWAARYRSLVSKGGVLVTLVFPIDGEREGGPPYSVKVELYETLLAGKDGGFTKVFQELPEKTTHPDGKETMCVWRRD